MELAKAIQLAEKLLADHSNKKRRPPTSHELQGIQRLIEHASTSAK